MKEESILILNMLGEGKITAEQADLLLRAVKPEAPTPPPPPVMPPPSPAPSSSVDPATLAAMQNKLGELQNKLGDLQGKIGAAQAAKAAGQAVSFAGKVLDHIPRPDVDFSKINKAVDEAMRGLHSFKNDAVRSAKVAARQAGQEAKRVARQSRRSMKFDLGSVFSDGDRDGGRPANTTGEEEATEHTESSVTWAGATSLSLGNTYGNIKVAGDENLADDSTTATLVKTAWAASEADARVLLQQIFLTSRVEGGRCRVEVIAPADARGRVTVDYEIRVPRSLALEVETTFGEVTAEEVSASLTVETGSGRALVRRPVESAPGVAKILTRSGGVELDGWNAPGGSLSVETTNGDVSGEGLSVRTLMLSSRTGDVKLAKIQTVAEASLESVSGDVSVSGGSVGTRASVKTQSGDATVQNLRVEQMTVESVSGDAVLKETSGALTVKTISGDITAEKVNSPAVSLATVSGDARWSYAAPFSGSFAGTTVSGDLTVSLWNNSDTRIEMSATSGRASCDLALSDASPESDKHISGKLGDGTGSLKLQSVSGDLRVKEDK